MVMFPEKLESLLCEAAASAGVDLYHWELSGGGGQGRLLVYIDAANGVTSGDCERASRAIKRLLDEDEELSSPYMLEVSSPGVERRLYELWHYRRAVGKKMRVWFRNANGERRELAGRLEGLSGEAIVVNVDGETIEVPLAQISRAQLVFEPRQEGR